MYGQGLGFNRDLALEAARSDDDGVWTFDVHYIATINGYECFNCRRRSPTNLVAGESVRFSVYHVDAEGKETVMQGREYAIKMPVSLSVASPLTMGSRPIFTFYPYFFSQGGTFTSHYETPIYALYVGALSELKLTSKLSDFVGERTNVVYAPPGFLENPKPEYHLNYFLDTGSFISTGEETKAFLDRVYLKGYAEEAFAVGFGDYRNRSHIPDDWDKNRVDLLLFVSHN